MSDCSFLGRSSSYDSIGPARIASWVKMFGGYGCLRRGAVGSMRSPSSLFYDLSKGFDFISNFFENGSPLSLLVSSNVIYSGCTLFRLILLIYYYSSCIFRLLAELGDDSSSVGYLARFGPRLFCPSYRNFLLVFGGDIDFLMRVLDDPSPLFSKFVMRGPHLAGWFLLPLKEGSSSFMRPLELSGACSAIFYTRSSLDS